MPRILAIVAAISLLAGAWLAATASVEAKQRSSAASKHRANAAAKHASSSKAKRKAAKRNATARKAAKRKRLIAAKPVSLSTPPRTPVDKYDCIDAAQTSYGQAQALFRRKSHGIPRQFEQVISQLNQLCGEEEFEKARISIEWMHRCLANIGTEFCSVDKTDLCAIDPKLEVCSPPNREDQS